MADFDSFLNADGSYSAGFPSFPRNFSRDGLLTALISNDVAVLKSQLLISSRHQGTKFDPMTGEEPGKIHHEVPGVSWRKPYFTTYNACDTTALYILGIDLLRALDLAAYATFMGDHAASLRHAVAYIKRHVRDNIFYEFPPIEEIDRFSLRVTYWKDSVLPLPGREEPDYPVAYALVQFMAASALNAASGILGDRKLDAQADDMFKAGIREFITADHFTVLKSGQLTLNQPSSDELHCLRYIPAGYRELLPFAAIIKRMKTLETHAGYACTPREIADRLSDNYHGYMVWPFEQALIHQACQRFGLEEQASVAERCYEYIDEGWECFDVRDGITPSDNSRQLWSVAAKEYFASIHATSLAAMQ